MGPIILRNLPLRGLGDSSAETGQLSFGNQEVGNP